MAEETVKKETEAEEKPQTEKKKPKKKNDEAEKLKKELESAKDLLLRTAAEFDNYKKRTERERLSVAEYAKASVIKEILPVIDNIERASASDKESEAYIKGIEMIVKQLSSLDTKLGIEKLAEAGDTFDPKLHEAVLHIEDEEKGESEITKVLQQGYKIGGTVIRPAMVEVAN